MNDTQCFRRRKKEMLHFGQHQKESFIVLKGSNMKNNLLLHGFKRHNGEMAGSWTILVLLSLLALLKQKWSYFKIHTSE